MAVFTGTAIAVGFSAATAASIAAAVTQLIVGVALNVITQELFGPDDEKKRAGIVGTMQLGAEVPRSIIMGRYATAGSLVYHNHWGHTSTNNWPGTNPLDPPTVESNNDYYTRVTALSDAQLHSLTGLIIDGVQTTIDFDNPEPGPDAGGLDRGYPLTEFTIEKEWTTFDTTGGLADGFSNDDGVITGSTTTTYQLPRAWVKFYDGTQTAADDFLQQMVSTTERPWTNLHVLRGMAYAVVTLRYDEELFKRLPEIKYIVEGLPLYDPRDGLTKNTRNPILMMRALTKGITVEGQWLYGAQQPVLLDDAEIDAMINVCGTTPPGWAALTTQEKIDIYGTSDPISRYQAGIEILVDTPIADALEQIALSCNGVFADTGSHLRILVGEQSTPAFSITDGDFRSTKDQGFDPFPPLAEAINGITATYPSPQDLWEVQDAPPLYNSDYEAEDDNRRLVRNVDLNTVPWAEQAERLMKAALTEARRARSNTGTLPACYWDIKPGDYVTYASDRNGYPVDKLFRVTAAIALADGDVAVSLLEMDPDAYDWTPSTDYTPPTSAPVLKQALPPVSITDFTVKPSFTPDAAGVARRPAILLEWQNPDQPGAVTGIAWQVRVAATGRMLPDGSTDNLQAEAHLISADIVNSTAYEVRIRTKGARPGAWTVWKPVTTLDIRLAAPDLADSVNNAISGAQQDATDAQQDATQALADASAAQADHDALVLGFTGTLAAAFDDVDGVINTTRTELESEILLGVAKALPNDFAEDGKYWTRTVNGSPATALPTASTVTYIQGGFKYARMDARNTGAVFVNTLGTVPKVAGRTWRIDVRARLSGASLGTGPHLATQIRGMDSSYAYETHNGASHTFVSNNVFVDFEHEFTIPDDASWLSAEHIRFLVFKPTDYANAATDIDIQSITVTDITEAAVNRASITQEAITRASEDTALAGQITTLTGEVDGNAATITDILGVDITTSYALGVLLQDLQVDAGGNSSFVSVTGSAIATIEGNMAGSYSLAVGAGGANAGLFLFASDNIGGSPASGVAIRADQLTVSAGRNLLTNTDFSNGLLNWATYATGFTANFELRPPGISWAGETYPTLMIHQPDAVASGYAQYMHRPIMNGGGTSRGIPCKAGDWVEFSAKLSAHRCTGVLYIFWYNATGGVEATSLLDSVTDIQYSSTNPSEWVTRWGVRQAPANTAYALAVIRKNPTISPGSNSYLFIHEPQLTFGHANQLEPTPYARGGVTLISGDGIVANSVTANEMAAGTITAASGIIANLAVDTLQIADRAVTFPAFTEENSTFDVTSTTGWHELARCSLIAQGVETWIRFDFEMEGTLSPAEAGRVLLKIQRYDTNTWVDLTLGRPYNSGASGERLSHSSIKVDTSTFTGTKSYRVVMQRYTAWAPAVPKIIRRHLELQQFMK